MNRELLLATWRAEETGPPGGWDFSHLAGRLLEDEPPWDFPGRCRRAAAAATAVLDLGTGGGELLAGYADVLPPDTTATEGWPPNVPVAARRLAPLRIPMVFHDGETAGGMPLPFPDGRFDLVLDRHESYDPAEVARVLRPGGRCLTQQVGAGDLPELDAAFGTVDPHPEVRFEPFAAALAGAGLTVTDGAAWRGRHDFADVATLVAYLQLVPWRGPGDFSVARYADTLLGLHAAGPARGRPVAATKSRFWLAATRAAR